MQKIKLFYWVEQLFYSIYENPTTTWYAGELNPPFSLNQRGWELKTHYGELSFLYTGPSWGMFSTQTIKDQSGYHAVEAGGKLSMEPWRVLIDKSNSFCSIN